MYIYNIEINQTKENIMSNGLKITDIKIYPVSSNQGKLRALARIVLNDCFQLTNLRIYDGSNGLFVSYPIESSREGDDFRQVFYPTKKEAREYIETEILAEFEKLNTEAS